MHRGVSGPSLVGAHGVRIYEDKRGPAYDASTSFNMMVHSIVGHLSRLHSIHCVTEPKTCLISEIEVQHSVSTVYYIAVSHIRHAASRLPFSVHIR